MIGLVIKLGYISPFLHQIFKNTSLAGHRGHSLSVFKIQNGTQGVPQWLTGPEKVSTLCLWAL